MAWRGVWSRGGRVGWVHLAHLAVEGDRREAEVTQHQSDALRAGARAAEHHERVAGELVQEVHQVDILQANGR